MWQVLASVFIPGFCINRVVHGSQYLLAYCKAGPSVVRWAPVALGLSTIPFIVEPIDHGTNLLLDASLRKVIN